MATPTSTNRLELQSFGSNPDTWGVDHLNVALQAIDQSLDGVFNINVTTTAAVNLAVTDYVVADFRNRILKFTGNRAGNCVVTMPVGINKYYIVINEATSPLVIGGNTISATGMYIVAQQGGVTNVYSTMTSPVFTPVVDNISTAPSINVVPTLNGQAFVIDPASTVTTIAIQPTLDGAEDLPEYVGYNYLNIGSGVVGPYDITVTGLRSATGAVLTQTIKLVLPFSHLRLARVPNTRFVYIAGGWGYTVT